MYLKRFYRVLAELNLNNNFKTSFPPFFTYKSYATTGSPPNTTDIMMLMHEFHVLILRNELSVYDPRSFFSAT